MTSTQLDKLLERVEARVQILSDELSRLEEQARSVKVTYNLRSKTSAIFSGLSDSELSGFSGTLTDVANQIIGDTFGGDYEIFFDPVGTTGYRVCVRQGDLEDTVEGSQGEGFKSVVSLSLLLASTAISPVVRNGFILFDEPFPGVRGSERLSSLYRWLSSTSNELGVQLIIVAIHDEAVENADHVIYVGEMAE